MTDNRRASLVDGVDRVADLQGQLPGVELRHRIGRGPHTDVFSGEARGREVAVKVQAPSGFDDPAVHARRFRREAALLASLSHPAVPEVFDVGTIRHRAYLVAEFVKGYSLASLFAREPMDADRVVDWTLQLLDVLDRIHARGLVHRNLTPDNILLDRENCPRLIDFGFARRRHTLEKEGAVGAVGGLRYASPEQLDTVDAITDARSDLFSVGLLVYEALSGTPLFDAASRRELIRQHDDRDVSSPPTLDDVDPVLSKFVGRLLRPCPDERFPSARGAARFLQVRYGDDSAPSSAPTCPAERRQIVGRESTWQTLEAAWRDTEAGDGRAVLVTGDPGVGKSFLVEQFIRDIPDLSVATARQKADANRAAPLSTIRQTLHDWLTELDHKPGHESCILDRLTDLVAAQPPPVRRLVPRRLRPEADPENAGDALDRAEFLEMAADLVLRFADILGEAILFVDDLQWIDDASRNVLERLVDRITSAPLLLVATSRDACIEQNLDPVFTPLDEPGREARMLESLDRDRTRRLIADYLGTDAVDEALTQALWRRTDGNPFLVVDYLFTMIDADILRPHWEGWEFELDGLDELELSDDSLGLVEARLTSLEETHIDILAAAALIGHRVDPPLLVTVCETDEVTVRATIEAAVRAGILARKGLHYEFVHDRLRNVLCERLEESRRADFHLATAAGFEENLDRRGADLYNIAAHYLAADTDARPEAAHRALTRAGHSALEAFAHEKAIEFLERAADLADAHTAIAFELDDWAALGDAYAHTGRYADAVDALSTAADLADDPFRRAELRGRICQTHIWNTMDTEPARTHYERALRELGDLPATDAPVRFAVGSLVRFVAGLFIQLVGLGYGSLTGRRRRLTRLRLTLYSQGQQVEYWELHPVRSLLYVLRGFYAAGRLGPSDESVKNYSTAAAILGATGFESGARWTAETAVEAADTLDRPVLAAIARNRTVWSRFEAGHQLEAGREMTAFLEESGQWLDSGHFVYSCAELIWNFHLRGYTNRAHHWYERCRRRVEHTTVRPSGHRVRTGTAMLAHRGAFEEAETLVDKLRAISDDGTDRTFRAALYLHGLASLAYFRRDGDRLARACRLWEQLPLSPSTVPTYPSPFYVYAAYGTADGLRSADESDPLEARLDDLVAALAVPAGKHENLAAHLRVLQGSLAALTGDEDRALHQWDVAERFARQHDNLWALFEIRHRRARLLDGRGDREMALDQAGAALQLAERHEWDPLIAKILDEFPEVE